MHLTRRHALASGLAAGTTALIAAPAARANQSSPLLVAAGPVRQDPFALGVASGDPTSTGVVLWTRLAVDPLAADGLGGMPGRDVPVQWQVADNPQMRRPAARGTAHARAADAHSVHVEVEGLRPGREYWYRFKVARFLSPVARTRTAPALHEMPATLAMSFASCAHYEVGYFTAYRYLADDEPDLVLHLGDYQYDYGTSSTPTPRKHVGPETVGLDTYRLRHAQYKSDPDLQSAHAIAPWLVVWDDHEVDNNWAAGVPENERADQWNDTPQRFLARRANAFRAYYENMPLRRSSMPRGSTMQIHRRLQWGRLATFHMLDTRGYRDDQACEDGWDTNCEETLDPARSITGDAQEAWLTEGFRQSDARWDILGQQVFFSQRDGRVEPELRHVSNDAWDGYVGSRERITQAWQDAGVRNPVVLTGDVHKHWAADIKADYDDPDSQVLGTELVASSVTSGGDGDAAWSDPIMEWNPHLKFSGDQRGYVRTTITRSDLQADFRSLDRVTTRGSSVRTQARFRIADGVRGLQA
ncbi:alkaline phosphatase D family protein [Janibacter sp. GS2]|uniref:alkaline phosphatase D family protein n=1 Tax=Janibacter sp. GS2 TaxID=3442646 RepID=UPI003EB8DFD2